MIWYRFMKSSDWFSINTFTCVCHGTFTSLTLYMFVSKQSCDLKRCIQVHPVNTSRNLGMSRPEDACKYIYLQCFCSKPSSGLMCAGVSWQLWSTILFKTVKFLVFLTSADICHNSLVSLPTLWRIKRQKSKQYPINSSDFNHDPPKYLTFNDSDKAPV